MDFSTTLLREKFVIRENREQNPHATPIIALSNRMVINLPDATGNPLETFVVRAQSMHCCIRMAAALIDTYFDTGPILPRAMPFNYKLTWEDIIVGHERQFNPERWVAIYNHGKLIYSEGERHMFLDMIEKCDAKNPKDYDYAVHLAEEAFATLGKNVSIQHESNIGLISTLSDGYCKSGLILRNPNRPMTFNIIAENKDEEFVEIADCLSLCAAFLEGIQIAFHIGMTNEKFDLGKINWHDPELKRAESGKRQLARLSTEIRDYEGRFKIHYRPEKPEFSRIVGDAEIFTRQLFSKSR